jgi:hypothetical protein
MEEPSDGTLEKDIDSDPDDGVPTEAFFEREETA